MLFRNFGYFFGKSHVPTQYLTDFCQDKMMLRQLFKIFILVFVTCQLCAEVNGELVDGLKGIFSVLNRKKGNGVANRVRRVIDNFLLHAFVNKYTFFY